jgi:dCMP deaminase
MVDWIERWFVLCDEIGSWSKDKSTKIGCVIVGQHNQILSSGYNGFPRGVDDVKPERHERPAKYLWTEHAERNAIYNAARHGVALEGSIMYIRWFPCCDCARAIIQSGISRLVAIDPSGDKTLWREELNIARDMMLEAGIDLVFAEE